MLLPLGRSALLFLCTLTSFAVLGRAPGAVSLRTREIEFSIKADGKAGRETRFRSILLDRPAA